MSPSGEGASWLRRAAACTSGSVRAAVSSRISECREPMCCEASAANGASGVERIVGWGSKFSV